MYMYTHCNLVNNWYHTTTCTISVCLTHFLSINQVLELQTLSLEVQALGVGLIVLLVD